MKLAKAQQITFDQNQQFYIVNRLGTKSWQVVPNADAEHKASKRAGLVCFWLFMLNRKLTTKQSAVDRVNRWFKKLRVNAIEPGRVYNIYHPKGHPEVLLWQNSKRKWQVAYGKALKYRVNFHKISPWSTILQQQFKLTVADYEYPTLSLATSAVEDFIDYHF